jgi:hypothetical protein
MPSSMLLAPPTPFSAENPEHSELSCQDLKTFTGK